MSRPVRIRSVRGTAIDRARSSATEEQVAEMLEMLRRIASAQRRALFQLAQEGFLADPGLTLEAEALIQRIEAQTSERLPGARRLVSHGPRRRTTNPSASTA